MVLDGWGAGYRRDVRADEMLTGKEMKPARIPVRIQMWLESGTKVEARGWLDEFSTNHGMVEVDDAVGPASAKHYAPSGHTDFTLKFHRSYFDPSWKFSRGKPQVEKNDLSV